MLECVGYAATDKSAKLAPYRFQRQEPQAGQVQIDILYCGVCHSDLHQARNEWGNTVYPCLPGHEICGRVSKVGNGVSKFREGDLVGVGCMIDSCSSCEACKQGLEQYCEGPKGWTATYNGPQIPDGSNTFGGYSNTIVVRQDFVLRIPDAIKPELAASILCAGVTTFSPLRHWKVGRGQTIGVVGLGGLGHMATKLARALGAEVVAFTRTPEKLEEARNLGASDAVLSTDKAAMGRHASSLDFVLSTIPEPHDVNPYLPLLKRDGHLVIVGLLAPFAAPVNSMQLVSRRRQIGGSLIGGIPETQEVLDFCAAHGIAPEIQIIPIDKINDAYDGMQDSEVRFRYVIDMASLQQEPA